MHQNDQKSLNWEIQRGQKVPKCSFNQDIKDKKKKKKIEEEEEEKKKIWKILPSWKLEEAT